MGWGLRAKVCDGNFGRFGYSIDGVYARLSVQGGSMANRRLHRDTFGFRKLEVYHRANGFFRSAYVLGRKLRRNDGFIRTQFLRAALSIKLNIAEGSGEIRPLE